VDHRVASFGRGRRTSHTQATSFEDPTEPGNFWHPWYVTAYCRLLGILSAHEQGNRLDGFRTALDTSQNAGLEERHHHARRPVAALTSRRNPTRRHRLHRVRLRTMGASCIGQRQVRHLILHRRNETSTTHARPSHSAFGARLDLFWLRDESTLTSTACPTPPLWQPRSSRTSRPPA